MINDRFVVFYGFNMVSLRYSVVCLDKVEVSSTILYVLEIYETLVSKMNPSEELEVIPSL